MIIIEYPFTSLELPFFVVWAGKREKRRPNDLERTGRKRA
jgi:hypothetical protein